MRTYRRDDWERDFAMTKTRGRFACGAFFLGILLGAIIF